MCELIWDNHYSNRIPGNLLSAPFQKPLPSIFKMSPVEEKCLIYTAHWTTYFPFRSLNNKRNAFLIFITTLKH